ncbi:DNA-3-methyladenine glycosylase [Prosthecomicrobium pneumaticum]|uniref:Putative 3-methyladenine DNA glycosylase n=1 Tax=Prosthecomicrobium pneumaticum TaxID=81895 RepID=A0A7W9L390_9HYPH|nr:DNA-3-methyladenine glycosylase [Prosthecomicrobium pneumaticum]MBB5754296.1 DNA-3-methyladenine glycosylase [Prosthecomicrobium pneumaticum]
MSGSEAAPAAFDLSILAADAVTVAAALVGVGFFVEGVGGVIVETEAYREDDPASHSFGGPRGRNRVMFGPPGRAYVYRSYGIHWCMNVVCGREGEGQAVLLRAIEPTAGLAKMMGRRGVAVPRLLASGPGRLCQALGIAAAQDGADLAAAPFRLTARAEEPVLLVGRRIGISRAVEQPWRFGLAGSPFLSRPFRTVESGAAGA